MTQDQIAEKAGLHQSAISRAIRTGRGIRPAGWRRLAVTLGVPVESIFGLKKA